MTGYRADLHVHPLMDEALFFFRGRPGDGRAPAGSAWNIFRNQVTLEGWRGARMGVAVCAAYSPVHTLRGHLVEQVRQLRALQAWARAHEERVEVALDLDAIPRIAESGRTAIVPAVEGGHGIRRVEDVDALFEAGARMLTLVHFIDNRLATAAARQLKVVRLRRARNGLTALGRDVVARMRRLGMVADLAHASDRTAEDVLALHDAPVVFSHTGARTLCGIERNASDELVQRATQRGGLVGVITFREYLRRPDGTPDFTTHVRHFEQLAGRDALAYGTDFNGMIWRANGIRSVEDLPALDALDRSGPNAARTLAAVWALRQKRP
jgi:membrane dipeptidase